MTQKENQAVVRSIRANCEFLSAVEHRRQVKIPFEHRTPQQNSLCAISVSKLIVQVAYLLFTCLVHKVDIYLSSNPICFRRFKSLLLSPKMVFFLKQEEKEDSLRYEQLQQHCQFVLYSFKHFNRNIINCIDNLYQKFERSIADKSNEQKICKISIAKLIEYMRKFVLPQHLANSQHFSVMKAIEKTEVFINHSDLLLAYKGSIFYQIKNNAKIINEIRKSKLLMKDRILEPTDSKNYRYIYKELDNFLIHFLEEELIFLEKSSTKGNESYIVGEVVKVAENGKEIQKYISRFLRNDRDLEKSYKNLPEEMQEFETLEKVDIDKMRREHNCYTLEYEVENSLISLKNTTFLEANTETIDIISAYCANISFMDFHINLENMDLVKTQLRNVPPKRFLAFKSIMKTDLTEEPFTKVLLLLEFLSICTKMYLELIAKRPLKHQTLVTEQHFARLDHLLRLFVDKANNFYSTL